MQVFVDNFTALAPSIRVDRTLALHTLDRWYRGRLKMSGTFPTYQLGSVSFHVMAVIGCGLICFFGFQ